MKKIFFGWFIVAAGLFFTAYNSLLFVYGFTAFLTPITLTFGWSSAQVALASSLRGLQTGTMDPLVGPVVDRWPARKLMIIGLIIYALGIIVISRATNIGIFYTGFLIVGLGGAISITMIPSTVIARWFKKNIGKASALLAVGTALGGIAAPLLVKAIDTYTWQDTLMYLAIGLLILGIPVSFVFRNSPQEYGMLPDGQQINTDANIKDEPLTGVTVKEAIRMRAFWFIGIATMLQMIAINAVTVHIIPYLTSIGFEKDNAAVALSIFSTITIIARLFYGVFADMFSKRLVLAASMLLTAIGLVLFQMLDGTSFGMVIVFSVVYGIGIAGAMPLRTPIIREYFGVKRFGSIFGLLAFFLTLGTSLGAPFAGWIFDTRGEYNPVWFIFAGLSVVGMLMMLTVNKPREVEAHA